MRKIIIACLGILLLSGASVGAYFGVDSLENDIDTSITPLNKPLKPISKPKDVKKTTYTSLNQIFSLEGNYYKTSENQDIATQYNKNLYKSLIDKLLLKGTNVQDDDVLLIPSYYYDLYARKEKSLKRLSYKDKIYTSLDYELINSLNIHVLNKAKDKQLVASFVDFLKTSELGRSIINLNMETLTPYSNNLKILPKSCFNYELLRNSESRLSSLVGYLYSTLSCQENYGFSGFSLSDFISTFLEINPRVVTIVEKPENYGGSEEFVSLSTAKALSNVQDLQIGDKVTIFEDIRKFLSSLTLDSLDSLSGITSTIKKNSKTNSPNNEESNSPIDLLKNIIETNYKFSSKTSNTMLAVLLGVLGSVSKIYKESKEKYNHQSAIEDGDILSTIISKTSLGISNLIKGILYNDVNLISFFLDFKTQNNNNSNEKLIDLLISNYEIKTISSSSELKKQEPLLEQLRNDLQEKIDSINLIQKEKTSLSTLEDYIRYLDEKNLKEILKFEYFTIKNELDIKKTLLESYKNQLILLEKGTSLTEKGKSNIVTLKESIFNLELDLSKLNKRKITKEQEIKNNDDVLESLKQSLTVSQVLEIEQTLIEEISIKNSLEDQVLNLERSIEKEKGFLLENNIKTNALEKWKLANNNESKLDAFRSLPLLDSIQLFIDFVSFAAYDAFETLQLGSYDENDKFQFKELNFCGLECLDVITPFFKEKNAISVVNKLIDVFNSIVSQFSSNSLKAAGKFLISSLPSSLFTLLNLNFSFLNIKANFRNGIDIKQSDVYGLINGISGAGGGVIGSIIGGITGVVRNRIKGKSPLLGLTVGTLIGLATGASVGFATGSGLAYKYFGDGNLKINKPNARVIDIIMDLKKEYDEDPNIAFNLFLDGNTLLKENYIPELNDIYKDLFQMFSFSDESILNEVESFNFLNTPQTFGGWEIGGEIFKLLVMSPYLWKTILDRSNYENNWLGNSILKETVKSDLKNALLLSKETLKSFAKTNDLEFIDNLYNLELKIIDWFLNAFFIGNNTNFIQSKSNYINIGYDPNEISLINLELLGESFKSLTGSKINFNWINYTTNGLVDLDAYLTYEKIDSSVISFSKEPLFSLRKTIINTIEDVTIPIYKTAFIPITSIFNSRKNIDEKFLISYLKE